MFEFTIPGENAPQSPRSLTASIAVHGIAVLLIFAFRFSDAASFPAAPEHFTLLAPAKNKPILPPKLHAQRPREFRPLSPALVLPAAPIIPAPAIEILKPLPPELSHQAAPIAANIPALTPIVFSETKPTAPAPKPVIKTAGFESSAALATTSAHGVLPAVGSFESDASPVPSSQPRRATVASAAFGDTTVEKGVVASRQTTAAAQLTPVEIISKPKPAYTAEARSNRIEGEVLLDVRFSSTGTAHVLRVVRALGHGLDETAITAAEGIRFHAATRDGVAADSTALVHIVFQLAN